MIKDSQRCEVCGKEKEISLFYGPHYFCQKHFISFFEARIRKTIRKYKLFKPHEKLLVALSGGKDSITLLHILNKYYKKSNPIEALIIDEGVKGYRNKAIKTAIKTCKEMKIKYNLISFKKEFGITNDEIMPILLQNKKLGGTCAFCGTMRRNIMNKYAKEKKQDKLLTGHNLDDEVQSFVMNVFNNDFDRLLRMGATSGIIEHDGFIKRIKPLYETPENEIIAYCSFKGIKHYSDECCPYSWTAKRNEFREMLNTFDNRFAGTKFSILRFYEKLKKELIPSKQKIKKLKAELKECKNCKEPTEKDFCKTCEMIKKLKKEKQKNKPINKQKNKQKINSKINKKTKIIKSKQKISKTHKLTCKTTKYKNKLTKTNKKKKQINKNKQKEKTN
jgi:uncharacterized protein (TIGR00269 family)